MPLLQQQVQRGLSVQALVHKPCGRHRARSTNACTAMHIDLATLCQSFVHAAQDDLHLRCTGHTKVDFGVPSTAQMQVILRSMDEALAQGGKVYVHCRAGIGRTGTVAAAWLVNQGLNGQAALDLLLQKWQAVDKRLEEPHTPETEAQRQFVLAWETHRSS